MEKEVSFMRKIFLRFFTIVSSQFLFLFLFLTFSLSLFPFLTLEANVQNAQTEKKIEEEEYRMQFSSLNLLPPEDISVKFDFYKIRWRLKENNKVWKENILQAGQATRLDLPPGNYEFHMELFKQNKIVASSGIGKCQKLNGPIILNQGPQEVHIPVCAPSGESTVSNNMRLAMAGEGGGIEKKNDQKKVPANMSLEKGPNGKANDNINKNVNDKVGINGTGKEIISNVLLFGDSGTGTSDQYKVAMAMQDFCQREQCDFSLMMGDNIYEKGVSSVNDKQFYSKFEKPYGGMGIDFYVTLGNHDTYSGAKGTRAQIEYSQTSQIWNMPATYYQFSKDDADFFSIDSNTILIDEKQKAWLTSSLANSKARWKVVFAHHPMYSTGPHGLWDFIEGAHQEKMRNQIAPILCQNGVDMYISGHDHLLEINHSECGVVHVISGASAKTSTSYSKMQEKWKDIHKFAKGNQLGFAHMALSAHSATLRMLGPSGEVLFTYNFPNRD